MGFAEEELLMGMEFLTGFTISFNGSNYDVSFESQPSVAEREECAVAAAAVTSGVPRRGAREA